MFGVGVAEAAFAPTPHPTPHTPLLQLVSSRGVTSEHKHIDQIWITYTFWRAFYQHQPTNSGSKA